MILTSKNNPLVKETAALKEKKARKEQEMFLVEGRKMATECLKSDFEIDRVFVSESYVGETPFRKRSPSVSRTTYSVSFRMKRPLKGFCVG